MNKRTLGKTGIEVSEIAFGAVEIGLPYGIGVNSTEDMLSETEAIELLNSAFDKGINFFDTARAYGRSESIIGRAFKNKREKVVIGTKCKLLFGENKSFPSSNETIQMIISSLHESLDALKTDYVDIFMLHNATEEILDNNVIADTFQRLKSEGLIKATGASTYTTEETKKAVESGLWDVVQVPFNLMDQTQESIFSFASERGVGIVVRSVLLKGILSEKGRKLHSVLKDVETHVNNYNALLTESISTLPMLATKFALSFKEVSSVLVGIDKEKYLQESLEAANGVYLDDKTLMRAKELRYPDPHFLDLVKWQQMGWLT